MIVAGEASGDEHASVLMEKLLINYPDAQFYGIGGDRMIAKGLHPSFHIKQVNILGFYEVIKHLPFMFKVRDTLLDVVKKEKIDSAILIDYPGFNLRIAKKLKLMGLKTIYYISPQIWAWGKKRIVDIKKYIDLMLVILPFEEEMFNKAGVRGRYVGHPLIEKIKNYLYTDKEVFFEKYGLDKNKEILLVMPGSRKGEIHKIFSKVMVGAREVALKHNLQIVVGCAATIGEDVLKSYDNGSDYKVIQGESFNLYKLAKVGIVKSGTSTLEAALSGLPIVIVYITSAITYFIGKNLVKLSNIGLANIVANETIVPELIQGEVNAGEISNKVDMILGSEENYRTISQKLLSLRAKLGEGSASDNGAEEIVRFLSGN